MDGGGDPGAWFAAGMSAVVSLGGVWLVGGVADVDRSGGLVVVGAFAVG